MTMSRLMRPGLLLVVPVLVSALAWLVPGESMALRGFDERASVTVLSLAFLAVWYLLCLGAIQLGVKVGAAVAPIPRVARAAATPQYDVRVYHLLTVLSTIGVLAALYTAQQTVSIGEALLGGSGNALSESLGGEAGILTLRYTSAVAAPIGLYLRGARRVGSPLAVWNVALLVVNALFTSRLSLMMALVVYGMLVAHLRPWTRVRTGLVVLAMVAGFAVLAVLNYFRNSNFYREVGVDDPLLMNVYQVVTYLGTPFQVAAGSTEAILSGALPDRSDAVAALEVLLPTFLGANSSPGYIGLERYAYQVDIADSLTTNSALGDTFAECGWWGLVYVLVGLTLAGMVYGHARRYGSVVVAAAGVVGYGFAEVWRIYLFNQGILVYLVLAIAAAGVVAALPALHGREDDAPVVIGVGATGAAEPS